METRRRSRDTIGELTEAANVNDRARARELDSQNQAINDEANSIARRLGAKGCAA